MEALALVAANANRPIVSTAENAVGRGSTGGFLIAPSLIGKSAAKLAMRVLDGENPASIPIASGDVVRPIFDWRQMQRWGVNESQQPPGSKVRFHVPTAWEQYLWQIVLAATVLAVQTFALIGLLYERRRRRTAEALVRTTISELAHMDRLATAGELSASIAHEVSQPTRNRCSIGQPPSSRVTSWS